MKKVVLKYGLIGGLIVGVIMLTGTLYCVNSGNFEGSMVIGYASMILAFSLIFVAVKQVRDKQYGGIISFGKAFKTALLVTLVTSTVYVIVWLLCYYFFIPDFMDQYTGHMMDKARSEGLSAAALSEKSAQMEQYKEMYKNPVLVVLFTYVEILPVGLLVSLVAALILKKKNTETVLINAA
ncbi:MAG: DUF4199 domain-containing protein [Rhizobacter sp.]|nr:DUF4199 domain-containing protein [Ferruginibacter sp.]